MTLTHRTAGGKLTRAEYEASNSHIVGAGNYNLGRTATYVVAASDSPTAAKETADSVCDGTADEVQINAAMVAAAGGVVYLHKGTYKTANEVLAKLGREMVETDGHEKPNSGMGTNRNLNWEGS